MKDRSKEYGRCHCCGRETPVETHHEIPICEGGIDGPTVKVCMECHIKIHSEAGQFSLWGKLGGIITAARHEQIWRKNLSLGPRTRWKKSTIVNEATD